MERLIGVVLGGARAGSTILWLSLALVSGALEPVAAMEGAGGGENDPFAAAGASGGASLFTGAATVSVPILLPPGRIHTTPDLELGYSSHAGLSEVGRGWSLTIGAITRSTRHGVPRCTGSHTEDFVVSLNKSSNELVKVSDLLYQLKVDEGYSEIIPDPVANTWRVRTRDGLTYHFGESDESRVYTGDQAIFFDASPCSFTTAWHLTRIEDPNGNHLEIRYEKHGNRPIPAEITYGGNAEVPIAHPFRVRVESEALPSGMSRTRSYRLGVQQTLRRRIQTIIVEARTSAYAEFEEVRRYTLGFEDLAATQEFLLDTVSTTGLPDRTFAYSTSTPTLIDGQSGRIPTDPILLSRQFPTGSVLSLRDMNGDGLLDRVRVVGNAYRVSYGESLSDDQFTAAEYDWALPSVPGLPPIDRIGAEDYGQDLYLVVDIDGDGIPDFVIRDPAAEAIRVYPGGCGASAYDCGFSTQYMAWNNPGNLSIRYAVAWNGGASNVDGGRRVFRELLDMNADGLPDLVRAQATGLDVHLNDGTGFETSPSSSRPGKTSLSTPRTRTRTPSATRRR